MDETVTKREPLFLARHGCLQDKQAPDRIRVHFRTTQLLIARHTCSTVNHTLDEWVTPYPLAQDKWLSQWFDLDLTTYDLVIDCAVIQARCVFA